MNKCDSTDTTDRYTYQLLSPNNFSGCNDADGKRTDGDKIVRPKTEKKMLSLIIVLLVLMRTFS